jgi:enamine deaminase RidA (YjgF/YER057c/UK114 family)
MNEFENKMKVLGLELPSAPSSAGNYLPYRMNGNTLYLAGAITMVNGELTHTGKVGEEQTVETGYEAARVCTLNAIANMKAALGDLDRVDKILLISGFVNAVDGFTQTPAVINGASDLLVEIFGEAGKHARVAVSTSGLPLGSTVEIQITLAVKD